MSLATKDESVKLRPASGVVDQEAITAWLAAKDYAFLDPLGMVWHLSANQQERERNQREHIANPGRMAEGVIVGIHADHVGVNGYRAYAAEPRALELIRWLVATGEWWVERGHELYEPLGDAAWLFSEDVGEHLHIYGDVTEGIRYTWDAGGRELVVHSSGQWRADRWRGELSRAALDEWNAAVANVGELVEHVSPDTATATFDLEDVSILDRAYFDAGDVPPVLRPIAALVARWEDELANWTTSRTSRDLRRVRDWQGRAMWTAEHLALWMLAKMRSPRVDETLARLGRTRDEMRWTADALSVVFDHPGHTAAEYRRILGWPRKTRRADATGAFAGSWRHEYELWLWPDVVFVINEHPDGYAWGYGFEGGDAPLPADLSSVEPWRWTADRLRREASATEILEEWSFDLDANLTFADGARYTARFDLGLLQTWTRTAG